jgi:hypothetical protein
VFAERSLLEAVVKEDAPPENLVELISDCLESISTSVAVGVQEAARFRQQAPESRELELAELGVGYYVRLVAFVFRGDSHEHCSARATTGQAKTTRQSTDATGSRETSADRGAARADPGSDAGRRRVATDGCVLQPLHLAENSPGSYHYR